MQRCVPACLVFLLASSLTAAPPTAYRGARIHTAAGKPIAQGTLVVQDGKILAVGPVGEVVIPADAVVVDVGGKTIIPGLVDTHSHVGLWSRPHVPANSDGNEGSGPVQSTLRAIDSIQPADPGIRMAVSGGVTTANIMPGSGNVIGGQTVYVKLRGRTIERMRIDTPRTLGGLKMANGENPKRFNFERTKSAPATRMKIMALQREHFLKAREYQRKWQRHREGRKDGKESAPPDRDLALEPLVEVLEGKRTVHFHCHRADDLMSALRLADEFGFEIVLQHATEGYRVADELARRKAWVSLTLVDSPGGKAEVVGLLEENAALLDGKGVKVAINTDDAVTESRFFLRTGAIAVRGGLSEDQALKALTLHGAQMLHLDDRVGSLEAGKDADFVVLSGAPFSVYSLVLQTYVDGVCLFDRTRDSDWVYQTGGFALADRDALREPGAPLSPAPAVRPPAERKGHSTPKTSRPERLAVFAGRIHTAAGGAITDGVILVEKGKIVAVGKAGEVRVPAGTPALYAAEVTPGLIDTSSCVGLAGILNIRADLDENERSDPNQADLRVLDGFNPREPLLDFLCQQGVTVVHAVPGPGNVIAGQTGIFRTAGVTAEQMKLRFPAGVLVNLGESPKEAYPNRLPTTRMGTAALVRTAFNDARNYLRKRSVKEEEKWPAVSLKLEALALALEKKVPVIFSAHRADDLQTALRLAEELKVDARLEMATEGYLMADLIAKAKVPVVAHPTMQRAGSIETYNSYLQNAAILAGKGIPLALASGFESYVPRTRVVRWEAAMAMAHGLSRERALAAITLEAARILKLDDRLGSIEPGKAADLVLYDGDPFEHSTHVTHTLIEGRIVHDRGEYLALPFERRALPLLGGGVGVGCCLGW